MINADKPEEMDAWMTEGLEASAVAVVSHLESLDRDDVIRWCERAVQAAKASTKRFRWLQELNRALVTFKSFNHAMAKAHRPREEKMPPTALVPLPTREEIVGWLANVVGWAVDCIYTEPGDHELPFVFIQFAGHADGKHVNYETLAEIRRHLPANAHLWVATETGVKDGKMPTHDDEELRNGLFIKAEFPYIP